MFGHQPVEGEYYDLKSYETNKHMQMADTVEDLMSILNYVLNSARKVKKDHCLWAGSNVCNAS